MNTNTPRTDEQVWTAFHHHEMCDVVDKDFARQLEIELASSLENQVKAEIEIKEIRNALGDDGRRTHKELIELATKAAEWRTWKEKYIDLRNAHIAEGQDPDGTIWEHADKLQKELKETKAGVARLREELATMTRLFIGACEYSSNLSQDESAMFEKLTAGNPYKKSQTNNQLTK